MTYGKLEYCCEELLVEVVSFGRTRHHEEDKEQLSPMTMVLILWSTLLFAAFFNSLEIVFPH